MRRAENTQRSCSSDRSAHGLVWVAACTLACSLSASSCRRPGSGVPPRPHLVSVEVDDASRDQSIALETSAISAALRRALLESKLVEPDSGDAGTGRAGVLRVKGQVGWEVTEVDTKGIGRAGVTLRLATRPSDGPGAINEELSAASEQRYDVLPELDRRRVGQRLVERTVVDLIGGFVARARLATATPSEIHLAIVADGGALRGEAIRQAGARGLRGEVPTLLGLLQSDDETVRDAALGSLIALRERRAVTELTRHRSLRDRHEMLKILEAISILGGEEAEDYLSFVAQSHDDEEIRKLATDAKSRLERRAADGAR